MSIQIGGLDTSLLRRKKTGLDIDPAKLKARQRAANAGGSKASELLQRLPDMKLAEIRGVLKLRNLNPLGSFEECRDRLRQHLEEDRDASNTNVSSIQYRQAAREAREAGDLPVNTFYDQQTSDHVLGPLQFHATGQYRKEPKHKTKKSRKVKQRIIHEFDVPGGRMKAGYINHIGLGWGHHALEYITINDWPVKNVTWAEGDWNIPPSHTFEFRKQWYELIYRGNPIMGPPSLARCDAVQDSTTGNIKLVFRYLGNKIPDVAHQGAVPKRIVKRYDVVGVRNAVGPQPKGYEEALAALNHKEYLEEQHQILDELQEERQEWITGHDEQGYLYYARADGSQVDGGGLRQYEVPEVQQLLEQQLSLLGYMPGILEERKKARRAKLAAEKLAQQRAEEEAQAKKIAAITAEVQAVEERCETMTEDLRQETNRARRATKEAQLHKVRLQLKKLREYLHEVAARAGVSVEESKSEQEESEAVMEFKPLSDQERRELEEREAEEARLKEEEELKDPDQPVGDPQKWRPRAVVKWFLASKVSHYAGAFEAAEWDGAQLLAAEEADLEAIGIRSHIHRVIILRLVMALQEEWKTAIAAEIHAHTELTQKTNNDVLALANQVRGAYIISVCRSECHLQRVLSFVACAGP